MKFLNKSTIIGILLTGLFFIPSCDLVEEPRDSASKDAIFSTEQGLQLYTNSFYDWLPSADDLFRADYVADNAARRDVPPLVRGGVSPTTTDDTSQSGWNRVALGGDVHWGWNGLRNINYFLVNNTDAAVPAEIRQHYNGIARFFRAFFYFEKVKRYGDVPWIDTPLDVEDEKLFGGRDSREVVMANVLADLDFAIANIRTEAEGSRSLITKDVALALKSRVALFEGTFRKYHANGLASGLGSSANNWLQEAVSASQQLMQRNRYSVYTGSGDLSYQHLFLSDDPTSAEDILVRQLDGGIGVRHSANWVLNSATTGVRYNLVRTFIHTYLNSDGTPFTNNPNFETMTFLEEIQDRDNRLYQTIRTPLYNSPRGGIENLRAADWAYTYTGYQPTKFTEPDKPLGQGTVNTNTVPIFRYAEVLLNYAEAKAELGTLTDADWAQTIGALRSRAGITGGLNSLPAVADNYLQSNYFPDISDPVLLEVRRERGIELVLEGHRFYDIVRWGRGELFNRTWSGIYVPQANEYLDLTGDGSPNIYFFTVDPGDNRLPGVTYLDVRSDYVLSESDSGELLWRSNVVKQWMPHYYFYPIPENDLLTNPNLGQNPGW
ncbi:MAG: RagB/SusD family nutrient uptake outer membrane protein [Balneolaceae bacterium]|nr:MAG: RagB/SusD family nutrient uptake outer membrane protein [Balneolaceae bacterium]